MKEVDVWSTPEVRVEAKVGVHVCACMCVLEHVCQHVGHKFYSPCVGLRTEGKAVSIVLG